MSGTGQLPSYVTLHEWEKDGVDGGDSDDEATSDCEAAFIDPEEAGALPSHQDHLTKVIQRVVPTLRLVMQYLIPSFLLPRSREPKRLHPTAWLGMSIIQHLPADIQRLKQIL